MPFYFFKLIVTGSMPAYFLCQLWFSS